MRKMLAACTGADLYEGSMKPLCTDDENTILVMRWLSCILPFHPETPLQNKGIIYANEWNNVNASYAENDDLWVGTY